MRAQVLNELGHTFEAVQAARQATTLSPDWPEAHITLARVQQNLGEPQLALLSYQAAAKLQPGHPDLVEELPRAQMLAKLHRQQPSGARAHVVDKTRPVAAAVATTAPPDSGGADAAEEAGSDGVEQQATGAAAVDVGGVAEPGAAVATEGSLAAAASPGAAHEATGQQAGAAEQGLAEQG